jgi:hypothetical protein
MMVRFYEFCGDDDPRDMGNPNDRKPTITLRHINALAKIQRQRRAEFDQRKILMGLMYGDSDGALDARANELDMRERELALHKAEVQAMIDQAEVDDESHQQIQKMAGRFLAKK